MKKKQKTVKIGPYTLDVLPSGSFRLRKMYKGTTYTIIFEEEPTQKEIIQALSAEMDKAQTAKYHMSFKTAAERYIEDKRNVLSPSTIRGYVGIINGISSSFSDMLITDITSHDIQVEINKVAKDNSPKTVRNYHGFISAVLGAFCPNTIIRTTLPQKRKKVPYIPSDEDIKMILARSKGTRFEIPILLACFGLRRSEICALTLNDIEGDVIHITKAKVQNENKEWVTKTTKTTDSTRDIVLPMEIIDMIMEQGYVYDGNPNSITDFLTRIQKELGMPHFSLHKLRHYFASKMSAIQVPEENILQMGGWKTDYVMKNVYRHALEDKNKQMQRTASNALAQSILQ